jgi:hypothetical protein
MPSAQIRAGGLSVLLRKLQGQYPSTQSYIRVDEVSVLLSAEANQQQVGNSSRFGNTLASLPYDPIVGGGMCLLAALQSGHVSTRLAMLYN